MGSMDQAQMFAALQQKCSLRSRRKRGGGRGGRTREKNGRLGPRDEGTPATKTPIFSFLRPPAADWLIFDSKSHENDVI